MLQIIPQHKILDMKFFCLNEIKSYLMSYIDKNYSETLNIDISHLNIIDSISIITDCAAKHFIKYPNGNIEWIVSSVLVEQLSKDFELGNNKYRVV